MSRTKYPLGLTPYKGAKRALKPKGKPQSYGAQNPRMQSESKVEVQFESTRILVYSYQSENQ